MKSRFSSIDINAVVKELKRFLGMRVMNVYDVDNKTYLIRLAKPDEKAVILLESGIRIHSTEFDWPKNPAPSGFSMKMRKHLRGRRFEKVEQLGTDRIVDLQFGSGEAAYHVILELYDRGNIVLTDHEYTIFNILRPRTDNSQDVRFAVKETYPIAAAKQHEVPTLEKLTQIMLSGKEGDPLKKLLIPQLDYGPALIEHCLLGVGFPDTVKIGKGFNLTDDMGKLMQAISEAEELVQKIQQEPCKGYIIQKKEKRAATKDGETDDLVTYDEFHPFLFRQHEKQLHVEFPSFDRATDEFFSKLESQKLDLKTLQWEKTALKKLENVKKDHDKRIQDLQKEQESDTSRGQLIEMNLQLVDQAILVVRSALANQIDWSEIWNLVKEAQLTGDAVANSIKSLKLDTNHITLLLKDPYVHTDEEDDYEAIKPMKVDIDLSLSAYANSRKYFDKKKQKAKKEQKTIDASKKALKSAEHKTKQTLKEAATVASINKTRKTHWFEKFLWFISSENYLVIGGRDQQQNELVVKKYLRAGDLYVHADLHGASSVVVKNPTGEPVSPKTLTEAGTMAICNSAAWDAKVVTSAWWVYHDQVSKTAPSGEYLTTGSFMVRGKKNYLPPSYLIYGFGFLFKLEDGSVFRHKGERRVRGAEEDEASVVDSIATESDIALDTASIEDDDDDESDDGAEKMELPEIVEEEDLENRAAETVNADGDAEREDAEVKEQDSSSDEETAFPDTNISLQHVQGEKFSLQRGLSTGSTASAVSETDSSIVFLGDEQPVTLGEKATGTKAKLSAKQRRELRKQKKGQSKVGQDEDEEDKVSWLQEERKDVEMREPEEVSKERPSSSFQQQQQQPKRGQKAKLKKIKEKYKDQDDEERELRMELLGSAGPQKEEKKKKGKKGREQAAQGKQGGRPPSGKQQPRPKVHLDEVKQQVQDLNIGDSDMQDDTSSATTAEKQKAADKIAKAEDAGSDDEKADEEVTPQQDDSQILDTLTGLPVSEDELLYAIPVCAPYSVIVNYKFKVKLMPGSTKRGKAAKLALNMFQHDKNTSSREKDLLKIQKDTDLSRNMPGKVKVAAPNLHKQRK